MSDIQSFFTSSGDNIIDVFWSKATKHAPFAVGLSVRGEKGEHVDIALSPEEAMDIGKTFIEAAWEARQ